MTKLDDDNNTDFSFFETTQNALDLASTENMLPNFINGFKAFLGNRWSALFSPSIMFCFAVDHIIFSVADVLCYLLVLLHHQNTCSFSELSFF